MELVPVVNGVHALVAELWQANIWDTGEGLVLVDTGIFGADGEIARAIGQLGRKPADVREIVVTHFHNDHRGGLRELEATTGAASLAHEFDVRVIRGLDPQPDPNLTAEERPFAESIIPRVPAAPPASLSREVREGDTTLGRGVVVHVPGHTPGSIALHVPTLGLLFTGDTIAAVNGRAILGPFNIDREEAKKSVAKLAALEFETACFGHGAPLIGGAGDVVRQLAERLRPDQ